MPISSFCQKIRKAAELEGDLFAPWPWKQGESSLFATSVAKLIQSRNVSAEFKILSFFEGRLPPNCNLEH